jgi:hypothetical protein
MMLTYQGYVYKAIVNESERLLVGLICPVCSFVFRPMHAVYAVLALGNLSRSSNHSRTR